MANPAPIRIRKPSEEGYTLLGAMFLLALFMIALSVALPNIAKSIQRDREVETMHRGKQYIRAIRLYYLKFGAYPPSVDALVNTNNLRFLRKKYIDPMTGKDDWKPILYGQNKAPLAMGFFGQPLGGVGGAPIAGIGPSGSGGIPGLSSGTGSTNTNGLGSVFGDSGSSFGSTGSAFGSSTGSSSIFGSSDSGTGTSSSGTTGTDSGTTSGSGSGSTTGSGTGFMSGQTGQTFGGGGIVGFSPASTKQSILVYKTKNHYNQWEFTYSPHQEMMQMSGNTGALGVPTSNPGNGTNSGNSTTGTSGTSFGGSSFSGSSFGGSTFGGSSSGSTFGSSSNP